MKKNDNNSKYTDVQCRLESNVLDNVDNDIY